MERMKKAVQKRRSSVRTVKMQSTKSQSGQEGVLLVNNLILLIRLIGRLTQKLIIQKYVRVIKIALLFWQQSVL